MSAASSKDAHVFRAENVHRGRYGPEPGEAGRVRKPVVRKTVDLSASCLRSLRARSFTPSLYERGHVTLPPSSDTLPFIPALAFESARTSTQRSPATGYCTKFITHSINKARTPIICASFTPDTRRVCTGAASGEITLWNGLTFNFETILPAHDDAIRAMAWGGEGHNAILASADDSGVIKLWQSTMNNLKAFKAHKSSIKDLCFAPQSHGERLASCSEDHTISIWDTERAQEIVGITAHGWDIKSCSWHPHYSLLASGSKDNTVKLWDPRVGGQELHVLHGHKNSVNRVRFNQLNGQWLATAGRDRMLKVWDLRTLKEVSSHRENEKELTCLSWHPIYEELLTTGSYDGDIRYWLVGEPQHVAEIRQAHDKEVNEVAWHPLGHLLVSVSTDQLTRYWARNKPGDEMVDKFNIGSLSGAQKAGAIMELAEAQRLNPQQQRYNDQRRFAQDESAMAQTAVGASRFAAGNQQPLGFAALANAANVKNPALASQPLNNAVDERARFEMEMQMQSRDRARAQIMQQQQQHGQGFINAVVKQEHFARR